MAEQELNITENVKGDNTYYNINLKDLDLGNYIIVNKGSMYAEGKAIDCKGKDGKTWVSYLCGVSYKDQNVSFFLNEKQHEAFAEVGGVEDAIKITKGVKEVTYKDKKGKEQKKPVNVFTFELVDDVEGEE